MGKADISPSRITVRPYELSDVDDMWEYATDKRMTEYTPWFSFRSKEEVLSYIKNICIPHPFMRCICVDGKSMGFVSVMPMSGSQKCVAEFGCGVSPEYWGRGVATEGLRIALADAIKKFPDVVRLQAMTGVENKGAQKVVEKIGCLREGVLRKYLFYKGEARDVVVYSILSTDPLFSPNKAIRSSL